MFGPLDPRGWFRQSNTPQSSPTPREQPIEAYPGYTDARLMEEAREPMTETPVDPSVPLPTYHIGAQRALQDWYKKVDTGGEWDFKTRPGGYPRFEGFGNYAFGLTGATLGIPTAVLLRGAGWKQERTNKGGPGYRPQWGQWWQGGSHGDDPADQASIIKGIEAAKRAMAAERKAAAASRGADIRR